MGRMGKSSRSADQSDGLGYMEPQKRLFGITAQKNYVVVRLRCIVRKRAIYAAMYM
jgi:hypothetical protein